MTTSKSDLRGLVRAREAALAREERAASDLALIEGLLDLPPYREAGTVLLYAGAGAEPDTRPIIAHALGSGKRVALPKITGPGLMEAREIRDPSELVPGSFGIPEPPEGSPVIAPEDLDLILVPGVAFTQDGKRLGRGGGYYDRYLPQTGGRKVALVRSIQLFKDLPAESHDVPVDILITDE